MSVVGCGSGDAKERKSWWREAGGSTATEAKGEKAEGVSSYGTRSTVSVNRRKRREHGTYRCAMFNVYHGRGAGWNTMSDHSSCAREEPYYSLISPSLASSSFDDRSMPFTDTNGLVRQNVMGIYFLSPILSYVSVHQRFRSAKCEVRSGWKFVLQAEKPIPGQSALCNRHVPAHTTCTWKSGGEHHGAGTRTTKSDTAAR